MSNSAIPIRHHDRRWSNRRRRHSQRGHRRAGKKWNELSFRHLWVQRPKTRGQRPNLWPMWLKIPKLPIKLFVCASLCRCRQQLLCNYSRHHIVDHLRNTTNCFDIHFRTLPSNRTRIARLERFNVCWRQGKSSFDQLCFQRCSSFVDHLRQRFPRRRRSRRFCWGRLCRRRCCWGHWRRRSRCRRRRRRRCRRCRGRRGRCRRRCRCCSGRRRGRCHSCGHQWSAFGAPHTIRCRYRSRLDTFDTVRNIKVGSEAIVAFGLGKLN